MWIVLTAVAIAGAIIWYRAFREGQRPIRKPGAPTLHRVVPNRDPTGDLDLTPLWEKREKKPYDRV